MKMKSKQLDSDKANDRGVSPVIGVILMVAITVILAAVIAAFVLDIGSSTSANANAGFTFDEERGTSVTVQLNSVDRLDEAYVAIEGNEITRVDRMDSIGDTATVETAESDYTAGDTIQVIGILDGEETVITTYETS
ncbi:type IV pilin [Natrialbaceae archaeon A-CW2]